MLLLSVWTFILTAATQRVLVHEVNLESAGGLRWLMLNHFWKMEIIIALISFAVGSKIQGRGLSVWVGSQLITWQMLITFIVAKNYWG